MRDLSDNSPSVEVYRSITDIDPGEWDSCASPGHDARPVDPFTTHRFLAALENSGSVSPHTEWVPLHLVTRKSGVPRAVMPLYAKYNSAGEYVFDYSWAHAFEQAGGAYYPKLQASVPFTPATGRRFLTARTPDTNSMGLLLGGALSMLDKHSLSSLHITFCTSEEARMGSSMGLMKRMGEQFHWINNGYRDFADFLDSLTSRKRRNIRKERRIADGMGGTIEQLTGDQIGDEHWSALWEFYEDTGSRKWGHNYLTRQFFDEIGQTMADDILLVMCRRNGRYIAGALNFIGLDTLYGRYWGCIESHSCLHFEVCYYQAIEFAIRRGIGRVEAGAGGHHKLARGYMPTRTHSLHWIANESFRNAVQKFLDEESKVVLDEISILNEAGPYKESA